MGELMANTPERTYSIGDLLRKFRAYERRYTGDRHDQIEWRKEFMEFVYWLANDDVESQLLDGQKLTSTGK